MSVATEGHSQRGAVMVFEVFHIMAIAVGFEFSYLGTLDSAHNKLPLQNEKGWGRRGGVCWIPRSTSSRDKMRGMGQEGVGYDGKRA